MEKIYIGDDDAQVQDKKDPLDFDSAKLADNIKAWSIDACSMQVKQRDKEEIEFLHRMQKYENHFNPEDKKAYRNRLRFFYLV